MIVALIVLVYVSIGIGIGAWAGATTKYVKNRGYDTMCGILFWPVVLPYLLACALGDAIKELRAKDDDDVHND